MRSTGKTVQHDNFRDLTKEKFEYLPLTGNIFLLKLEDQEESPQLQLQQQVPKQEILNQDQ